MRLDGMKLHDAKRVSVVDVTPGQFAKANGTRPTPVVRSPVSRSENALAMPEKSPRLRSAGGSDTHPLVPVCPTALPLNVRWRVVSSLTKKNNLFLTIGPPSVPPNTCTLDVPLSRSAGRK